MGVNAAISGIQGGLNTGPSARTFAPGAVEDTAAVRAGWPSIATQVGQVSSATAVPAAGPSIRIADLNATQSAASTSRATPSPPTALGSTSALTRGNFELAVMMSNQS